MTWQRLNPYCLQHSSGARIAKCGYGPDATGRPRHRYLAYGPSRAAGWNYRAWSNGSAQHWSGQEPRAHYALGEPIPQPRALIGIYDDADQAKAAIENSAQTEKRAGETDSDAINGRDTSAAVDLSPTGNRGADR